MKIGQISQSWNDGRAPASTKGAVISWAVIRALQVAATLLLNCKTMEL